MYESENAACSQCIVYDRTLKDDDAVSPDWTADQRENDRREREASRIGMLPDDEQQAAIDAEVIKQEAYDSQLRPRQTTLDEALASRVLPPSTTLAAAPAWVAPQAGCHQLRTGSPARGGF